MFRFAGKIVRRSVEQAAESVVPKEMDPQRRQEFFFREFLTNHNMLRFYSPNLALEICFKSSPYHTVAKMKRIFCTNHGYELTYANNFQATLKSL